MDKFHDYTSRIRNIKKRINTCDNLLMLKYELLFIYKQVYDKTDHWHTSVLKKIKRCYILMHKKISVDEINIDIESNINAIKCSNSVDDLKYRFTYFKSLLNNVVCDNERYFELRKSWINYIHDIMKSSMLTNQCKKRIGMSRLDTVKMMRDDELELLNQLKVLHRQEAKALNRKAIPLDIKGRKRFIIGKYNNMLCLSSSSSSSSCDVDNEIVRYNNLLSIFSY